MSRNRKILRQAAPLLCVAASVGLIASAVEANSVADPAATAAAASDAAQTSEPKIFFAIRYAATPRLRPTAEDAQVAGLEDARGDALAQPPKLIAPTPEADAPRETISAAQTDMATEFATVEHDLDAPPTIEASLPHDAPALGVLTSADDAPTPGMLAPVDAIEGASNAVEVKIAPKTSAALRPDPSSGVTAVAQPDLAAMFASPLIDQRAPAATIDRDATAGPSRLAIAAPQGSPTIADTPDVGAREDATLDHAGDALRALDAPDTDAPWRGETTTFAATADADAPHRPAFQDAALPSVTANRVSRLAPAEVEEISHDRFAPNPFTDVAAFALQQAPHGATAFVFDEAVTPAAPRQTRMLAAFPSVDALATVDAPSQLSPFSADTPTAPSLSKHAAGLAAIDANVAFEVVERAEPAPVSSPRAAPHRLSALQLRADAPPQSPALAIAASITPDTRVSETPPVGAFDAPTTPGGLFNAPLPSPTGAEAAIDARLERPLVENAPTATNPL